MERPVREAYGLGIGTDAFRCGTFLGHGGSVGGTQWIAVISPDGARGAVVALDVRSGGDPGLPAIAEGALCGSALGNSAPRG